ncbi:MAG: hypothetical protein LCH91_22295 [Bacteroidetes bacterium]|nr:hypothetical protein [Bacteroidota bacterium]
MSKELNNLISGLSEDNFKKLIQEFVKEKYKTPNVRIIDGPYDGGNDLEIIVGDKEVKKNIQITVQKSGYEEKLKKDLKKSASNVADYNYLNSLDFYINQNISKEKRNELENDAEINFGVTLKIIDSNALAQESTNYESIRNFTYEAHNIKTNSKLNIADKQTKILFDVLTLDHNSIEIKRNFINSYIYAFLYVSPISTTEEIFSYVNPHLNNTLSLEFLNKELNYLRSKHILESPVDKKKFQLSKEKQSEISNIYSIVAEQELKLSSMIDEFISQHKISCESPELINLLYKLYQENYTIDIEEIKNTNNSFSASIKKSINDLISFFTKKGVKQSSAKSIAKELLTLCSSSDFLNKLSSIHLFNNLYSSDKLEKYVNTKIQTVFLDTQILIRMICVLYNEKFEYQDTALQSVKILLSTFEKFKDRLQLVTSYDYISEVSGHLLEAVKLQRFLSLPFASKLGKSKNVFFNAYLELKEARQIDEELTFIEFIEELIDEDIVLDSDDNFLNMAEKKITSIVEFSNIKIVYHPNYPNYLAVKKEYEYSLANQSKNRSYTARENDLRTILYLSTKANHTNIENGEIEEPFLVTWDSAFYKFRKALLDKHKEFSYWYIYSPLKVVDRFSVINFQLNPQSINLNIVALTETNFNYSTKTSSFIDIISNFFNKEDVSKLSIINKLSKLRENTQNINEVPTQEEFKYKEESKITHLLLNLRNHYHSYEAKYKFDDIIKVFELSKYEDEILRIFETTITNFKTTKVLDTMFASFDKLIESNTETPSR